MKAKEILGHIDCPCCGTQKGMRVTHDKNGDPFGYCEAECGQQLRVGGDRRRVALFLARFPWAAAVTVTAAAKPPATPAHPPEPSVTDTGTEPEVTPPDPPKRKSAMEHALEALGVKS